MMWVELAHNGKIFSPDGVKNICILGLGSSFERIIKKYLDDNLPNEWNIHVLYKLTKTASSYKQLQYSKYQLFQSPMPRKKEKQEGVTTTAIAALCSHQNAIKMMIEEGYFTLQQEETCQQQFSN
eukprot:15339225-Ditylum_brightwellii.AAC.1